MSGPEKGEKGEKAHLKAQLSLRPSPASFLLLSYLSLSLTRSTPPAYARALRPTRPPLPAPVPAAARSSSSPTSDLRRTLLHPRRRRRRAADAYGSAYPHRRGADPRLAIRRAESRLGERLAEQGSQQAGSGME